MQLSPYRVAELREHARDVLELTRRDIAAGPCSVCDSDVGYTCERCRLELAACDLARTFLAEHPEEPEQAATVFDLGGES